MEPTHEFVYHVVHVRESDDEGNREDDSIDGRCMRMESIAATAIIHYGAWQALSSYLALIHSPSFLNALGVGERGGGQKQINSEGCFLDWQVALRRVMATGLVIIVPEEETQLGNVHSTASR
ncbi:uncharacterized protein TRIVIDRAFT_198294 [Trichoderma virens Gv29-8]|uniref:Uncharacterized protein n=1 Tax=Hypocrea virens (strain Gv29-8 / FGSC 10586) TaxID=413071 RepID=G9MIK1_HYPVG|nr:uncharacterized protein TRIVIDRAFT_198294 [Trichoderma virens Gv29-8]EHK25318.1 hypothetical protein TRIVIDRAFT_198294 [Trichoderma virens Gv29-8]